MPAAKLKQTREVRTGHLRADEQSSYVHVPFDVPAGAVRLEVEYTYSGRIGAEPQYTGGNTIDLGVIDARGTAFAAAGFRGWSGSERSAFFITEEDATPGYVAGPLPPGRWHVLLGLYKIAPAGCEYRVTITLTAAAGPRSPTPPLPLPGDLSATPPAAPYAPWLRGELHCHTWHSDGDRSPADVVRLARARGLDFLAITDHNTIAAQYELARLDDPGLVLIRGVEVTTFAGHMAAWGVGDWLEFRAARPAELAAVVAAATRAGALTSCNHPKPAGPEWTYRDVAGYDCIEVWNGPWPVNNQAALDFWLAQLAQGKRIPAVGGSDFHRERDRTAQPPRDLGTPTTWIWAPGPPTAAAILAAVAAGHVSLSADPAGPLLELRAERPGADAGSAGEVMGGDALAHPTDALRVRVRCLHGRGARLRLMDQHATLLERTLAEPDATVAAVLPVRESVYVRAELRGPAGEMLALTNPIYLCPE